MRMETNKFLDKIISIVSSTFIPAIIHFLATYYWYKEEKEIDVGYNIFVSKITLLSVFVTLLSIFIFHFGLPHIKFFRPYKQYEGKWLQIIPNLKGRPFSIIDFSYNKSCYKYELHGINFYEDLDGGIDFNAYKFVERSFQDGFYYITNQSTENRNALGKIGFVKSNYDNLIRAEGYFFDASNETESKKYNTILIKCDKKFFTYIEPRCKHIKIKKLSPKEIMDISKDFAKQELHKYKKREESISQNKNKCEYCSCGK